jgi:hypothetical protein
MSGRTLFGACHQVGKGERPEAPRTQRHRSRSVIREFLPLTDVGYLGWSMAQQQVGSQGVINAFLSVRGDERRGNDGQTAAAAGRSR